MSVIIRTTATATRSISLNPFGSPETVNLHFVVENPNAVPRYAVKLRATAAFDNT